MRRTTLFLALLACCGTSLHAQTRDRGLRSRISSLFIFGSGSDPLFLAGSGDPNNNVFLREHGNHFIPAAVSQNGGIIEFLIAAIGANVSNVPIGATSGAESFQFANGVPVRTSTSAGPIFAERSQTMGRGRALVGVGRSSFRFASIRGVPLDDVGLVFTHENTNAAGCTTATQDCSVMGVPAFENDVIDLSLDLDLSVDVTTLYATYGLFDRVDVGVVLPLVRASLRGRSAAQMLPFGNAPNHFFGGTFASPVLTSTRVEEGSAFGLGDVAVRTKLLVRESTGASLSFLADARFPSGDESDFLGSGSFSARGLAILSGRAGAVAPHINAGYLYRAGRTQNGAVLATGGFDALLTPAITLAADVVGELQVGRSKLVLPAPVQIGAPFKRTVQPSTIPDVRDDIVNGSLGFKFSVARTATIVANALVPLNRGGLRSNVIYTGALEYSF